MKGRSARDEAALLVASGFVSSERGAALEKYLESLRFLDGIGTARGGGEPDVRAEELRRWLEHLDGMREDERLAPGLAALARVVGEMSKLGEEWAAERARHRHSTEAMERRAGENERRLSDTIRQLKSDAAGRGHEVIERSAR